MVNNDNCNIGRGGYIKMKETYEERYHSFRERKQAKDNINAYKYSKDLDAQSIFSNVSLEHKQTCQRWLGFERGMNPSQFRAGSVLYEIIQRNIEDLKQAIKTYKDAGI